MPPVYYPAKAKDFCKALLSRLYKGLLAFQFKKISNLFGLIFYLTFVETATAFLVSGGHIHRIRNIFK